MSIGEDDGEAIEREACVLPEDIFEQIQKSSVVEDLLWLISLLKIMVMYNACEACRVLP